MHTIARDLVICGLLVACLCSASMAQGEPPADSIAAVQAIYARLHQKLWEVDDHFWHNGDYERCIATLRLITSMNPYDVDAYSDGAWLMQNQLRDDEAEAYLLEGRANNLDVYDVFFDLGYFYYMHERFAEAIENLEVAVSYDPPSFAWHQLAHAYEHAGMLTEALAIWSMRETIEPQNLVPKLQIERILAGDPPSIAPEMARHAREDRLRDEGRRENPLSK